ncbi:MAG: hypothetical protein MUC49_17120 [Raineya sp.]|jgi:hypothetical protein|nr:hypothetical protein [Raineya sp.]
MKFIFAKVNRYKIPPFIVLLVVGVASLHIQVLTFLFIIGVLELILYFLLVLTIGKLIKNDLMAILLNLGLVFLSFGMLLKITHWANANLHLIVGKVSLIFCLIIGCVIIFSKKN